MLTATDCAPHILIVAYLLDSGLDVAEAHRSLILQSTLSGHIRLGSLSVQRLYAFHASLTMVSLCGGVVS